MAAAANAVHGGREVERELILGGIFNPLPLDCGTNARVFQDRGRSGRLRLPQLLCAWKPPSGVDPRLV